MVGDEKMKVEIIMGDKIINDVDIKKYKCTNKTVQDAVNDAYYECVSQIKGNKP